MKNNRKFQQASDNEIHNGSFSFPNYDDTNMSNDQYIDMEDVQVKGKNRRSYKTKDRKFKHFERRRMGDDVFNQRIEHSLVFVEDSSK